MQRPITLTEKGFVQHFTSLSDDIQGGKAAFSVLPTSDVFQLFFFLLSILRKTFYLIIFCILLGRMLTTKGGWIYLQETQHLMAVTFQGSMTKILSAL